MSVLPKKSFFTLLFCTLAIVPSLLLAQTLEERVNQQVAFSKQQDSTLEALQLAFIQENLTQFGLPKLLSNETVIRHPGFALVYSKIHEQPKWVAHIILPDILKQCEERTELFLQDTSFAEKSVDNGPYASQKKKVYDRGHMAPAADLRWSPLATYASFYFSNISPQKTTLNQKFWGDLEEWFRAYVRYYESPIYIITGPVLKSGLTKLTNKENTASVSIPEEFFKIAVDLKRKRAIAFLVPQDVKTGEKREKFIKPIDDIERLTGIDFFATLSNALEDSLERQLDMELWDVNGDVAEVQPLSVDTTKGFFNSVQAKGKLNQQIKVCGKVISINQSDEDYTVRLTLDQGYDKGISSVTIEGLPWGKASLLPFREFRGKNIIANGIVKRGFQKRVNIQIQSVTDIQLLSK